MLRRILVSHITEFAVPPNRINHRTKGILLVYDGGFPSIPVRILTDFLLGQLHHPAEVFYEALDLRLLGLRIQKGQGVAQQINAGLLRHVEIVLQLLLGGVIADATVFASAEVGQLVRGVIADFMGEEYSRDFDGTLSDVDVLKLTNVSRNTYFKYKREMREKW